MKRGLDRDPRYDAVGSSSLREELFNAYVKTLSQKNPPSTHIDEPNKTERDRQSNKGEDVTRKERKQRAVREREAKVREERSRVEAEVARSKGVLSREEGESVFRCAKILCSFAFEVRLGADDDDGMFYK